MNITTQSPRRTLIFTLIATSACCSLANHSVAADEAATTENREQDLLSGIRQLTFAGRRAGEGYFSADGDWMVFQSEREAGNPFFQIYLMDLKTGDQHRVSPGHGKTTCAWIHPDGQRVLFASTHNDPDTLDEQQAEIDLRTSGQERRYSWDYDEEFELYVYNRTSQIITPLTSSRGYDAEGSFSPDGTLVAFASNRHAYTEPLDDSTRQRFETDPSLLMDIYLMNADGTDLRRLTKVVGYDGGPFFSPDGQRICWRRFSEDGARAEIMTMKIDGSDQQTVTRLGAMSWAPFYHPSGEYLIFATNRHGFANFELYMVDAEGRNEPVRVTYTDGFDGLPAFSPDGRRLAWTSNRTSSEQSQIFLADWNHEAARAHFTSSSTARATDAADSARADPLKQAAKAAVQTDEQCSPEDILRHVDYLCRPELGGRLTGSDGERNATAYVAAYFDSLGLLPAGDNGGWFQEFEFTSGVALGPNCWLKAGENDLAVEFEVGRQWRPLAFSSAGITEPSPIVFAGYGIKAPEEDEHEEYDSFVHLDIKDKWVMVLRYLPENITPELRQHLSRYSSLRYKAMLARDLGARGLVIVSGPNAQVKDQLIKLQLDGSLSGTSLPIVSVSDAVADLWMDHANKQLKPLQDQLDTGQPLMGFAIPELQLSASIDLEKIRQNGRNVLGRLKVGTEPAEEIVIVGAHIDHLGRGVSASSLDRNASNDAIHFGADDNASGVAAMMEIAQHLSSVVKRSSGPFKRDVLFAGWSGEELGLLGSTHFAETMAQRTDPAHPHAKHGSLTPHIAACLNLDMVGRMEKKLVLQGVGSSDSWPARIERRNAPVGLPITLQDDSYLPTDASVFFMRGVPILSAFTGSHTDYHTPRDTPDKLNYEGAAKIAKFMALMTRGLITADEPPQYVAQTAPKTQGGKTRLRAYLGTVPDYVEDNVQGVKLSGVTKGAPADAAGLKAADIIVELAGRKVENIYDYTYAIEALKVGQPVKIAVRRGEQRLKMEIVPGSRE